MISIKMRRPHPAHSSAMKVPRVIVGSIFCVLLVTSPALAASADHISTFLGQCDFTLPDLPSGPCEFGVMWMILRNGRSVVIFTYAGEENKKATFALSGGRDRQPNPEDYYQSIDTLQTTWGGKQVPDLSVEGECHFNLNEEGTKYYYIKCTIYNRKNGLVFKFNLNTITDFQTKSFNR